MITIIFNFCKVYTATSETTSFLNVIIYYYAPSAVLMGEMYIKDTTDNFQGWLFGNNEEKVNLTVELTNDMNKPGTAIPAMKF